MTLMQGPRIPRSDDVITPHGRISRREAMELAQRTLETAEAERIKNSEEEAQRGITYADGSGKGEEEDEEEAT